MKILWCILLHTFFAQISSEFGTSYLKNSRLCHHWACINTKLGLPDGLPPKGQYAAVLRSLLPQGAWQNTVEKVLDTCYNDRPRRYTNTCPGQALMHCVLDNLIENCPDENLRKNDACTPLSSIAGFGIMFSQGRYDNLEKNLPTEKRPSWFLKNYFSSKCCNLPELLNRAVLSECGFRSVLDYHLAFHGPRPEDNVAFNQNNFEATPGPSGSDHVNVVNLDELNTSNQNPDPLDCCDLSGFIEPSWRAECDFETSWDKTHRLSIKNNTKIVVTSEAPAIKSFKSYDVKILPQTCDKEICVFSKLGIISPAGELDLDAFSKLLDNMTEIHTSWVKAKARVVTKCLSKPVTDYVDDCEINKVLACTIDVLSENCPHARKHDPCKHTNVLSSDITCQISSSKYRPKNRRQFCGIPSLVSHNVLTECGLSSLTHMEYVSDPVTTRPKTHWWNQKIFGCKGSTDSTKCLLKKMGVLNKYGFMDYFKMKDRIRMFTSTQPVWSSLTDVYLNTFTGMPMYGEQCSTPKKFLNVLDSLLMTCPISKRKHSLQCNRILTDMAGTTLVVHDMGETLSPVLNHFQHVYGGLTQNPQPVSHRPVNRYVPVTHKNPIYSSILSLGNAPPVQIIDLKHTTSRPLVLLPVYLRNKGRDGSLSMRPYGSVLRRNPTTFDYSNPMQDADFIAM